MSNYYATFNPDKTLDQRLIKGVHPIPKEAVQLSDEQWHAVTQQTDCTWKLEADGSLTKCALPDSEPNYPAQITAVRFRHETAGITVNGVAIETARDSQALITSAALTAVIDPQYACTWKTLSGPVELNAAQLISLAGAVRKHVQACFDREVELLTSVSEGKYTPDMLDEGWPEGTTT